MEKEGWCGYIMKLHREQRNMKGRESVSPQIQGQLRLESLPRSISVEHLAQAEFEGLGLEIVHGPQAELVEDRRRQEAKCLVGIVVTAQPGLVFKEAKGVLSRHLDGLAAIIVA